MRQYLSLVKFSHTIFALPFAFIGFFLAVKLHSYPFSLEKLGLILVCMVAARNAAMAFNRWADRNIDAANPRTAIREIPAGILSANRVLLFASLNVLIFVFAASMLNTLCLVLSPVALLVILGYSYTKRFTSWCHFVLGLGLAIVPTAAYIAVTGVFHPVPLFFSTAVLTWVSGFDIIYALQDEDFDKSQGLFSIPSELGAGRALRLSTFLHFLTAGLLAAAGFTAGLGAWYAIGAIVFAGLLIYQHSLVKPDDLSRVNLAFFTTNGIASVVFMLFVIADLYF